MQDALAAGAAALAQLPDLPDPELGSDPAPYVTLFIVGFLVGVLGYLASSRILLGTGILMVFLATFLLPLVAALTR